MQRSLYILLVAISLYACNKGVPGDGNAQSAGDGLNADTITLTLEQAERLAELPLACMENEYPNRLGQTLGGPEDLATPKKLHPAFYGCFDWHSAVHGHWSLVRLLRQFPNMSKADTIRARIDRNLRAQNILQEVRYMDGEHNRTFERTYGWAWLLKLDQELREWDDPVAKTWWTNLQPLTDTIVERYMEFLPKLEHAIRVGEHSNTAFGLSFAWDYARSAGDTAFERAIRDKALQLFLHDEGCPLDWEPSSFDFLSPCLEEVDLMHRVLGAEQFKVWVARFLPQLNDPEQHLNVLTVSDREDGRLVHLDGLNFSRAWVLWSLAQDSEFAHLAGSAARHFMHSYPNLTGDSYEGGHWLASFALYALDRQDQINE